MSDAPVLVEKRGTTTVATLNRPSRRNALSVDLVHDLQELLTDLRYDSDTPRGRAHRGGGQGVLRWRGPERARDDVRA